MNPKPKLTTLKIMKTFLVALMALSGSLFFLASADTAEAGNRYRNSSRVAYCEPVRHVPVCRTPVYHRPVYRTPAVSYRQVYRPAYRVQYYRPAPVYYQPAPVHYRSYSRCR